MKKIKLGDLCVPSAGQIKEKADELVDYIDISSIDNETKKVTGYQTMLFGDSPSRARNIVKKGSILVSTVRPNLNAVAMIEEDTPNILVASTGFCVLDCKENVDNRFILNFCKSKPFIDAMVSQATGASYPAVSDKVVRTALVPDYTYEEQCNISEVLDKVSNVIERRKAELCALDNLIKARFVEMFGNGHDGFCNTKKLGEFCKFQQGTQVPVEEQIEEQLEGYTRFLRIIDYTQAPQIPRYVSVKGREIAEDSVVIVRYGATAGFVGHGYAGILANNLFEVVPDESILSKDFLYLALKYGTFEQEVHDKAFGAAMPALSFGMMNDIGVVTPNSTAQNGFVDFVHQVNKSKFVHLT